MQKRSLTTMAAALFVFTASAPAWAVTYTSVGGGGDWGTSATWSPNGSPGAGDTVNVGSAVNMNVTATIAILNVNNGGTLTFNTNNKKLTVTGAVTVNTGGTITVLTSGNIAADLSAQGNLVNAGGTLHLYDVASGNAVTLHFAGTSDQTISESGVPTWYLGPVNFEMGAAATRVINTAPGFPTNTYTLTFTTGTYVHQNGATWNLSGGNNSNLGNGADGLIIAANATIRVESGTISVFTGTNPTYKYIKLYGGIEIAGGAMILGSVNDPANPKPAHTFYHSGGGGSFSRISVTSGSLNLTGQIGWYLSNSSNIHYDQSSGNVTTNMNNNDATYGSGYPGFQVFNNGSSLFTFTGGTITVEHPPFNPAAQYDFGYQNFAPMGNTTAPFGTVQIGDSNTGAGSVFKIDCTAGNYDFVVGNGTVGVTAQIKTDPLAVLGNVTTQSGSTLDLATNGLDLTVGGNYANNGTLSPGTRTVTFNATTAGKTLAGTLSGANGKFYNLTFNGVGGGWSFTSNPPVEVANNFTITNGAVTATSATLTVTGSFSNSATFTHNGGTVTFNGTSTQTVGGSADTTFNNLTHTTSGDLKFGDATTGGRTFTVAGAFSWSGSNLIIGNNAAPALSDTLVPPGSLTIPATFALTMYNSSTLKLKGNWTNSGTFNCGNGTVEFNGAGTDVSPQTVNGSLSTFYRVVVSNNSTVKLNADANFRSEMVPTAGNFYFPASTNSWIKVP